MTGINLGSDFTVDLVNTGGATTVRANISPNVDGTALQTLITKYTTPTTPAATSS